MKGGDVVWMAALAAVAGVLLVSVSRAALMEATRTHPYLTGFGKFAVLATFGELLGLRIRVGEWRRPVGMPWRVLVWGALGVGLVLVFQVFSAGVSSAIGRGLLPSGSGMIGTFAVAFWISAVMNVTFAPTMMVAHRMTDAYIELTGGRMFAGGVGFGDVIAHIDWQTFFGFVVAVTIPFFWIPAHTITFLLPPEYRVLMAAFLSIALGTILALPHEPKTAPKHRETITTAQESTLVLSGK
jgi:hypothetical protein